MESDESIAKRYPEDMDRECVALCDAINKIPGIHTRESCCGHGIYNFMIFFEIEPEALKVTFPMLIYYTVPCHIGFRWNITARTDCSMAPTSFLLESRCKGKKAYQQANEIAEAINEYLSTEDYAERVNGGGRR